MLNALLNAAPRANGAGRRAGAAEHAPAATEPTTGLNALATPEKDAAKADMQEFISSRLPQLGTKDLQTLHVGIVSSNASARHDIKLRETSACKRTPWTST